MSQLVGSFFAEASEITFILFLLALSEVEGAVDFRREKWDDLIK